MLFRKIGTSENPLRLVADGGYLFGRELVLKRPIDVVQDSELNGIRWVFNERLKDPNWQPEENMADIAEWRADMAGRVERFRERAAFTAHAFFPDLVDVRGGQLARVIAVQQELSGDSRLVREIFAVVARANDHEPPEGFGPEWIGYRLLQAQLMWSLDHIARYGSGIVDAPMPRLENTYCDADYATIAAHADVFLSADANAVRLFGLMAPDVYCGQDLLPEHH